MKIDLNIFEKKEVERIIKTDKAKYILLTLWELLLMGCVVYIQYFLRAKETAYSDTETFLLGTLPSLFGAAAFVSVLFIYHKIYTMLSGRYKLRHSIIFSFVFTFFGFLLWEIIRMGLYPFDKYDILMTFAGCVISVVLIIVLFGRDLEK